MVLSVQNTRIFVRVTISHIYSIFVIAVVTELYRHRHRQ